METARMPRDFRQHEWSDALAADVRELVRLAVREDLNRFFDITTVALVAEGRQGAAAVVAREPGVIAGLAAGPVILDEFEARVTWQPAAADGTLVARGQTLAELRGSARDLLTAERTLLNFLGRLSGIATLTRRFADALAGTHAALYDTRKTAPGWRRLEKYAVRCGGGRNHRTGLYDAVLIKDNHLAFVAQEDSASAPELCPPVLALRRVRVFLAEYGPDAIVHEPHLLEIEVDSLDQLAAVLPEAPDIVLLDNMTLDQLRAAVALRNERQPGVVLEASGGVRLDTVRAIAETGVDRISAGALTHSAAGLDLGLDWHE